ncbi:ATP-binding protein [Bacillus salipaludis]|uniref:ATP-binding protein n=1 Tax=Bacillus salipaludis TaxID=2547811 RepID=A0AA90R865_9BACI|nr:ATP-binding protein [Bacillus salipaludis]MDQ6598083.1 ATP-binding protein [Bacillus salipaludis]
MRDIGYDLPNSIADLVDNSIAAGATEVFVDLIFKENESCIRIFDNGIGMSPNQIDEALRYGSNRDYSSNDLGKFGLGLKTASLSHCRKLSVASRQKGSKEISILMWDMDHIEKKDRWEALRLELHEANPNLYEKLQDNTGTSILWDDLDRVSTGSLDKESFIASCRQVEEHLGIVFHRFLNQEAKRKLPLAIYINGNQIKAWDPFVKNEPQTRILPSEEFSYEHKGKQLSIKVQPYILPHEKLFSSKAAHVSAAGPKKWNRQQGFYIYRNDRLIQSGGWNRVRAADEHTKLARVAIDFNSGADESFKVNIAKMTVQLPTKVRPELTKFASQIASAADKIYREGSKKKKQNGMSWTSNSSNGQISKPNSQSNHVPNSVSNSTNQNNITSSSTPNLSSGSNPKPSAAQNPTSWSNPKPSAELNPTSWSNPKPSVAPNQTSHSSPASNIVPNYSPTNGLFQNGGAISELGSGNDLVRAVITVLERELSDNPKTLNRIMTSLAKLRPEFRTSREE